MFGDTFDSPEDAQTMTEVASVLTPAQKKPQNMANLLDLPPMKRDINNFIGLRNLGGTCYLNSLIQALYLSPEFRNTILNLPLYNESIEKPSDFLPPNSQKFKIMSAFQKLFAALQESENRGLDTQMLADSFGWQNNEQAMQQDIQEANRVLFDTLERALNGTAMENSITQKYRGTTVNYLECISCGMTREREETFYDLILQVKGLTSVEESLMGMITLEKLEGSNQYECEICAKKVDAYKGIKIRKFPPILTLSLSRFEFDWEKMERKKINDKFQFGLELDVSLFAEKPELYEGDENKYELFAVLIHRGDAYGGHYHAYIRDTLNEGEWENKMTQALIEKELKEQQASTLQQTTPTSATNEEQKTTETLPQAQPETKNPTSSQAEILKNENEIMESIAQNLEDEESTDDEEATQQVKKIGKKKKNNKNAKKNNRKRQKREQKKNKDDSKPVKIDETEFDNIELPFELSNPNLKFNWFDFNDTSVMPIPANRIQKQFGGSSENAYILMYRQKSLNEGLDFKKAELSKALRKYIDDLNVAYENERQAYKNAEKQLEVITIKKEELSISERKFVKTIDPVQTGKKTRIEFTDKLEKFYNSQNLICPEKAAFVEVFQLTNGLIQFKKIITYSDKDKSIKELGIECWSVWIHFELDDEDFVNEIKPHCGDEWVPIRVNIRNSQGKDGVLISYQNRALIELRSQISAVHDIPLDEQLIVLTDGEVPKIINENEDSDCKDLKALGIIDNVDLMLNRIDPEEKKQREKGPKSNQSKKKNKKEEPDEILSNTTGNLISVIVESDDHDGVRKFFVDLDWTLLDLLENLKRKFDIEPQAIRRLKNLTTTTLYYEEEMSAKLLELGFSDGGIRLKIERGKIPQYGNLSIRISNQSNLKKAEDPKDIDIIGFPNEKIEDFKKRACKELNLVAEDHKLYQTDWLGDPINALSKEDSLIKECSIKQGDTLVLRDKNNLIAKELIKISLYVTKTGFPNDCQYVDIIQAREEDTLEELKFMISIMPKAGIQIENPSHLRLREMTTNMFFGRVLRGPQKALKKLNLNKQVAMVAQALANPENLEDDQMVLLMRKRNPVTKTYDDYEEFIWSCPPEPKINDLKEEFIKWKKLDLKNEDIELARYIGHEFSWLRLHLSFFPQNKNVTKRPQGRGKKYKTIVEILPPVENLKKTPYLLKDGEILGYRFESENIDKTDDFQCFEDVENRNKFLEEQKLKEKDKTTNTSTKKNDSNKFVINTDF